MPIVPIELRTQMGAVSAWGLLDTGAMVSVLPHELGLRLGMKWHEQMVPVMLTGNLRQVAWMVGVEVQVAEFSPTVLAFAWAQSEYVPLILGQLDFFHAFDVSFRAARDQVEILEAAAGRQ